MSVPDYCRSSHQSYALPRHFLDHVTPVGVHCDADHNTRAVSLGQVRLGQSAEGYDQTTNTLRSYDAINNVLLLRKVIKTELLVKLPQP